ncbi:MAG TPA: vanadium-dependent haloperoxidase [Puia sp.]|nr:vanadium-dependent haloperoxidase [Puia sp.]
MTDLMVHDITNPPLAARFFSYACLAGYEVISQNDNITRQMQGVLNGYPDLSKPDSIAGYSYQLAALLAMIETAKKIQPSGKLFDRYEEKFLDSLRQAGCPEDVIGNSKKYALAISKQILSYAKADGYNKISNLPRYTPLDKEGCWYPTPPAYIGAVEPYFKIVRPFTLDSSSQFKPRPPVTFAKDKNSAFYKMMQENYKETFNQPQQHKEIAGFWDCNPFAVQDNGHLLVGLKKISPGAHWLGITGIACEKAKKSFSETMQIYTLVSITLMDAFICCWDEKYRSNRIRPETAIRKYIDATWNPLLQTPPFPEYTSGHSTISAASSVILTYYIGNNFSFRDSVEDRYGLQPRTFTSFRQAADEAAISRFYGGIHFMDANINGKEQGRRVGEWVLHKILKKP